MASSEQILPEHLRAEMERRGIKQADLATWVDCSQGQISRLLASTSSTRSKTYQKVCKYVFVRSPDRAGKEILSDALDSCWDGSLDDAREIAAVLRALSTFRKRTKG